MPRLRLSIVSYGGLVHLIGPVSRRTIYAHPDIRRVRQVRDLFYHFAPEILDPPDANRIEVFADTELSGFDAPYRLVEPEF